MNDTEEFFAELRGEKLSAVTFVSDYLQLWFDGPGVNVINPLTVRVGTAAILSWSPGFRDALCGQIGKIVAAVEFREGSALTIRFEDGSSLAVSLRAGDYTSPEAAYAHGFKGGSLVA